MMPMILSIGYLSLMKAYASKIGFPINLVALDSMEYDSWMDARNVYMSSNTTHLTLILIYYGSLPRSLNMRSNTS